MDKLTVNTQIVSMRREVRRARVHVINKLVRESKKLKNKNGSEEQKKKNERKAERFMEEVFIIKPGESLHNKALARLSSHPNVSTHVSQFHSKFPTWNLTLPQILLSLGKKKKKKSKNSKGSESDKKTITKPSKETNVQGSCNVSDGENVNPQTSVNLCEDSEEDSSAEIQKVAKNMTKKESKKGSIKVGVLDSEAGIIIAKKSSAEVKKFTEHLAAVNSCDENTESDENVESTFPPAEGTTVDPFFVCVDGETEYLTNIKVETRESDETNKQNKTKVQKHFSWNKNDDKQENRMERRKMREYKPKNPNFRSFQQRTSVFKYNSGEKRKQPVFVKKTKEDGREKQISKAGNDGPVHPSWEAKKKLKDQQHAIFAFQGKKIKFDDD
ncbi:serum response factor-binding protein 1 isoform X2 [Periplaneta americana]|uniref:serum response factor-binding protein 1 isoform X2 n=1 Tax=Periplaneta americana TaxID=6978 RepID=UPI0037E91F46